MLVVLTRTTSFFDRAQGDIREPRSHCATVNHPKNAHRVSACIGSDMNRYSRAGLRTDERKAAFQKYIAFPNDHLPVRKHSGILAVVISITVAGAALESRNAFTNFPFH